MAPAALFNHPPAQHAHSCYPLHQAAAIHSFKELCKASAGGFLPGVIWRSIASPMLQRLLRGPMLSALRHFQQQTVAQALQQLQPLQPLQ